MYAMTLNGAEEAEAEEAESFYESRIVCGPIRELGPFNDLFSYDSFWEPAGFLPYQQFSHVKLPKLPLLNPAPPFEISSQVIADITKLSEHILKIYHTKAPTPFEAPFKLHLQDYSTYMQSALISFLQIISTPDPNAGSRDWKIQTFTRCFENIWKSRLALIEPTHSISDQEIIELNSNLRQSLALALDFKQGINFPNLLQREYRSLSNWAHTCTENISGKPVEALLVICLMKSCVNWRPPPPPVLRSASQRANLNLGVVFPTSLRRTELLNRRPAGKHSSSKMARSPSQSNDLRAFSSELAPLPGQIRSDATGSDATGSAPPHHKEDSDSDSDSEVDDFDDPGPFY